MTGRNDEELLNELRVAATLNLIEGPDQDLRNVVLSPSGEVVVSYLNARTALDDTDTELPDREPPGADALALVEGETVTGDFVEYSDNWYSIQVPAGGGTYVLETSAPGATSGADTVIELYDEGFNLVGEDDDEGDGAYSRLVEDLSPGTTYMLRVSSWDRRPGRYAVEFAAIPDTPADDRRTIEDVLMGQSRSISRSGSSIRAGSLQRSSPGFRFEIGAEQSGVYDIETFPPVEGEGTDTVIRLFSQGGLEIGTDDDGGDDLYSRLHEQLAPGTYLLRVSGYDGAPGSFGVRVTAE